MTLRKWMIFILGFAGAVVPGRASLSFYTGSSGQTAFNSAVSGLTATTIDLLTLTSTSGGLVDSETGVTFQDQNGTAQDVQVLSTCTSPCALGGLHTVTGTFLIDIVVPSLYTAISFNVINDAHGSGNNVSISATGFTTANITTSSTPPNFIGAVTSSGVSGLSVVGSPTTFAIDSVTVYSQSDTGGAVDERSTFFLFGSGLILLGFLGRFRRAAALS